MLYGFVKIIARVALRFYCRELHLNNRNVLNQQGPLMLAANHPNSFLDAILLCTIFDKPVYSLARGDAFKGKLVTKLLSSFKMLPVYRVSEGVENLEENYKTFDECKAIFKRGGIVLIFSEGGCINEWHLRALKKGTARLALSSWEDGIPLKVLPVGINYSSFGKFGKNIHLLFGEFIESNAINLNDGTARAIHSFNANLRQRLSTCVVEIDKRDKAKIRSTFYFPQSLFKRSLLFLPAVAGWVLHIPLYYPLKKFITRHTNSTDHFDSIVIALLFVVYPFYVCITTLLAYLVTAQWYAILLLLIFPATGWAYLQLKKQLD